MSAPAGTGRRGRRPQPERRAEMQARLLDATVECLIDVGWARTTLPEVVARAGVARGAQVHHFPTKAALMEAVGDHLLDRNLEEFTAAFEALPAEEQTLDAALDVLWSILSGPTWTALIELALAGRTDPAIAACVQGFNEKVDAVVLDVAGQHFPGLLDQEFGPSLVRGALALLVGLALQTSVDGDRQGHHAEVFAHLKLLTNVLSSSLVNPPSPGGSP